MLYPCYTCQCEKTSTSKVFQTFFSKQLVQTSILIVSTLQYPSDLGSLRNCNNVQKNIPFFRRHNSALQFTKCTKFTHTMDHHEKQCKCYKPLQQGFKTYLVCEPFSYPWFWAGSSLQLRLTWRFLSNVNGINFSLMILPSICFRCEVVPV